MTRPTAARRIVLHADDFGMSPEISRGILSGFRRGLLTSTSVLANAPAATAALQSWRRLEADRAAGQLASLPQRARLSDPAAPFDLGVHLNLTQGRPLTGSRYPDELLDGLGRFPGIGRVFFALHARAHRFQVPVVRELQAQIEFVLDHGLFPSHLNGHQYVELVPGVSGCLLGLAVRYGIHTLRGAWEPGLVHGLARSPLNIAPWSLACIKRGFSELYRWRVAATPLVTPRAYFGTCHAGRVTLPVVQRYLSHCRPGCTEIGLHPGEAPAAHLVSRSSLVNSTSAAGWSDSIAVGRPRELEMVTSLELAEVLERHGCQLGRLSELGQLQGASAA